MYITVDVVQTCSKLFPDNAEYYQAADGLRYENVLMGDVIFVNQSERLSEAENAVHIEADGMLEFISTPIPETPNWASFYARYADFWSLDDYREPLPTAWAFRYLQDPDVGVSTNIRAWKGDMLNRWVPDLVVAQDDPQDPPVELWARNCLAYTYYVWDEDENVATSSTYPWSGGPGIDIDVLNMFPLETQEVSVDMLNTTQPYGWMLFIWPNSNFAGPDVGGDWYQTWMGVQYTKIAPDTLAPEYSSFRNGLVMANYNCFENQVLPDLGFFLREPTD
jgi:hypothetical protein